MHGMGSQLCDHVRGGSFSARLVRLFLHSGTHTTECSLSSCGAGVRVTEVRVTEQGLGNMA